MADEDQEPERYQPDFSDFYLLQMHSNLHIECEHLEKSHRTGDEIPIFAHKAMLLAASPTIEDKFNTWGEPDELRVENGITPEMLRHVLRHVYCMGLFKYDEGGDDDEWTLQSYIDVQYIAWSLDIPSLQDGVVTRAAARKLRRGLERADKRPLMADLRAVFEHADYWSGDKFECENPAGDFQAIVVDFCVANLGELRAIDGFHVVPEEFPQFADRMLGKVGNLNQTEDASGARKRKR